MSEVTDTASAAVEVPTGNDPAPTEAARFTQADVDRIVKERLERADKKAAEAAIKAKADLEAQALAEQGKFKELHDAAAARVTELEPFKAQAERYEAVLAKRWDAERKDVPDFLQPLLEKMPVDERLDYITENRSKWTKTAAPNLNGAGGGRGDTRTEGERKALAAKYGVKPEFIN